MLPLRVLSSLALGLVACSSQGDPRAWISERAATVRCASPGKRPPAPAIAGVPAPPAPTGLFARQLDPIALDALGYGRDTMVCATLEAPPAAGVDAAAEVASIVALHDRTSRDALRAGGRCTCEVARAQGIRELIAACVQTPTITGCDPEAKSAEVAAAVQPLLAAIAGAPLPWLHWRLVGPTDRPGWFASHLDELVANHDGGSVVFRAGDPLGARVDAVVRAMLGLEHVVAVVRQDGGRALLIAREQDGLLILDHFRQPLATTERMPLVARIEAARIDAMTALLSPGMPRKTLVDPADGTLVEFDRPLLEEIDRVAVGTAALLDVEDAPSLTAGPAALFDRVAFVAPYGESGAVLRIEHALSVDGLAWAQTLGDAPLLGGVDALGLQPDVALPEVNDGASAPGRFVLRGTATERWGLHGVHRFATLAKLVEIAAPGAIGGEVSSWRVDWPGAPLPRELGDPAQPGDVVPFDGARRLAAAGPVRLEAGFDPARTRLTITLRPR
jgi:hypothetical protein